MLAGARKNSRWRLTVALCPAASVRSGCITALAACHEWRSRGDSQVFRELDFSLMEMNPVSTAAGPELHLLNPDISTMV